MDTVAKQSFYLVEAELFCVLFPREETGIQYLMVVCGDQVIDQNSALLFHFQQLRTWQLVLWILIEEIEQLFTLVF